MTKPVKKPMDLGSILDRTFQLLKEKFVPFFMIMLILTGPFYVFGLLTDIAFGTSLFREVIPKTGDQFTDFLNRISGASPSIEFPFININAGVITFGILAGLSAIILLPLARASIIAAIDQLQNEDAVSVKAAIKRAFSRFWPLLGSSIVYSLCIFGILIGFSLILILTAFLTLPGIIFVVIIYLAGLIFTLYLAVRWTFYYPAVLFEKVAPGLRKSWQLTRGSFWRLIGIYIVIFIITSVIKGVISAVVNGFLGGSILSEVISDLVAIMADMVTSIGFAVVYFDLRVRNDNDDLLDMLEDYKDEDPTNPAE